MWAKIRGKTGTRTPTLPAVSPRKQPEVALSTQCVRHSGNLSEQRRGMYPSQHKHHSACLSSSEPQANTSRVPPPSWSSLIAWNATTGCCRVAEHFKGQECGNGEWHKVVSMPNRAQDVTWQSGHSPMPSQGRHYANYGQNRASVTLPPITLR